ncbi:MAG: ionic transporter y4hA [Propionibacteriaceae bacterium]|nr:ionic transporter y4hA [Propionibacteriaceae bacterium]
MRNDTWRGLLTHWTTIVPFVGFIALLASWGQSPPMWALMLEAILHIAVIIAAVEHAEVIAHRVGEPFGSLILAVAVTIIEVGLIVMLYTSSKGDKSTLARDTVFAAVMITVNGIVGVSVWVAASKYRLAVFNSEGAGSALGTVVVLAVLTLVLPEVTTSEPGSAFSPNQLAFAAIASLILYGAFVVTQTLRHRDFFLPTQDSHEDDEDGPHAVPPSTKRTLWSVMLLPLSLVTVVGLTKIESPAIEGVVDWLGFPKGFVGVIVALIVLMPEMISAVKAALLNRTQISLNLGLGSAMASIGLTIPALAVVSLFMPIQLTLGLQPTQIVLLITSAAVATLTVVPGRAKTLHGTLHLVLFAAFFFLSIVP